LDGFRYWDYLSTAIADGRDGELRVANLFESHKEKNRVLVGCITKAKWYDTGDQKGLDRTRLSYGLNNPKTSPDLEQELISLGWTKNPSLSIVSIEAPEPPAQSAD
jgi:UTP-glucose-1-phosphate uridylyltransferase